MIGRLWARHRWLVIGFAIAVALTLFFTARTVAFWIYWADPAHRDEAIAGWMTPRYVAYSWNVPRDVVAEALALDQTGVGRRVTLKDLAAERGTTPEALAETLRQAIDRHRARP